MTAAPMETVRPSVALVLAMADLYKVLRHTLLPGIHGLQHTLLVVYKVYMAYIYKVYKVYMLCYKVPRHTLLQGIHGIQGIHGVHI